ncbi:MAG: DUF4349 domain-containing protein [Hyphomonadaceae bacterium]|nr:DUF4349 domain-containing protein [Hyphomonadaceae bacterium]
MLRISMVAGLALLAAACGNSDDYSNKAGEITATEYAMAPPPPPPAPVMAFDAVGGATAARQDQSFNQQEPGGGQPGQPVQPPGQMMAYTYAWGFQVPTGNMEGLLNAHKKLCEDAGPAKCYVVNSGISGLGQESSFGSLYLRASEDWVRSFEAGVENGLKPFDGTLDSNSRSGEDLTVQIVDGEARLNSMKTMRDRLQGLLKDRPGRLSDLLEIERELARVQADIDSRESVLAALKLRVAMSSLTLGYQPKYTAVSESIWRPLGDAFSNFAPNFAQTLAAIVEFIGMILPVVIFGGLGIWAIVALFRWLGRRRKAKPGKLAPAAKPPQSAGP